MKKLHKVLLSKVLEKFNDLKNSKIPLHSNQSNVAFFISKNNNNFNIGWHYCKADTIVGSNFHVDHGVGVNINNDGTYIWIAQPSDTLNSDLDIDFYSLIENYFK